jgi:DNA-binding transcriptional regulator LsrR (DeoR family)
LASLISSNEEIELMTRVASLYYLEDATQAEIGAMLSLSRPKVGRLLKRARDERIVEIAIRTHPALRVELESELASRFGLSQAILAAELGSETSQRALVGRAAADHLARSLRDGHTVAVGMGRNVNAVAENLSAPPSRRGCTFVCAIGGSPQVIAPVNPNDICRRLAEQFKGTAEALYAPAYAENAAVRESFLQHNDIREALARARSAEVAIVGVGDARNDSAVVQMGCFSGNEMGRLRQAGAVGDILGSFFGVDGKPVSDGMGSRVVGLLAADLRAIPQVIAIVTEPDKGSAVLGALRTGIIDVLVTTVGIARNVLTADSSKHERPA